jgi:sugar O-acyltransferase (sialic acid O-acetyltransferase NeuD family)
MSKKNLIIIGDGEFAEIAYEYFTHDSDYKVVGFAVEKEFKKQETFYDLPVYDVENLEKFVDKENNFLFVAITFIKLNRIRTRIYENLKARGYKFATYISSHAFVWHNAIIGENCFIFENNVIQHHVSIGNNVVLWSGNHVGHRTKIADNCFISSHVVISGYCNIGKNCFIGVNSTFVDHLTIGNDCFIAAHCLIKKNVEDTKMCVSDTSAAIAPRSSLEYLKVA